MASTATITPLSDHPVFKRPIKQMDPPMNAYDPLYLARKKQCPEQILKNGKQLAFFTEGELSPDTVTVVCFPAAGFGKCEFIPAEQIPGVFLVCIDDAGHGNSTELTKEPVFSESVSDVVELLDALGVEKFYVMGHSRGGCHALQVASALKDRVLGCATLSAPTDLHHSSLSKKEQKKLDSVSALMLSSNGCCKSLIRMGFKGLYYHPDKTKDFGFTGHSSGGYSYYVGKATGGAPKEICKDHFFVSKLLDAELNGINSKVC